MTERAIKGVDISYAQGAVNFSALKSWGAEFVIIKASQGKLLSNPSSQPFRDPRFEANICGAITAGMKIGVYHYLCAGTVQEARREAEFFLDVIEPYSSAITLCAACDAEEGRYLPASGKQLKSVVDAFCAEISDEGYPTMLYTNPNYLVYRFGGNVPDYPIWLAYWGASEARAASYNPTIWQYGAEIIGGVKTDVNIWYKQIDEDPIRVGDRVRVITPLVYGTTKKFWTFYKEYDVFSVAGNRVVIGRGNTVTAAIAAEHIEKV